MKNSDIEKIIENIKYADKVYEDITKYKKELNKIQSELDECTEELDNLLYRSFNIKPKVNIKKTFSQILDEISKENSIDKLYISFEEKICGGYFFRTDESKIETIEKEIAARGSFTIKFSIASNIAALENDPIFCLYPITETEKARRKRVEKIRKSDPLYSTYIFDAKPFSPMSNGVMLHELLKREEGLSAEMAWFFYINKSFSENNYYKMYYYIEPKYIDLDDNSILSKALKKILTEEELREYYLQKQEYEKLLEKRDQKIETNKIKIKELTQKIIKLNDYLDSKTREINYLKWPIIKIRLGDFIETIYKSNDTIINNSNSSINVYIKRRITAYTSLFCLDINIKDIIKNNVEFKWMMDYAEVMYDGKSLYQHSKKKKIDSWKKLKKVHSFVFYFNPNYFFKDNGYITTLPHYLNNKTIRKIIIKCMSLEIARQKQKPLSYAEQLYVKYYDLLTQAISQDETIINNKENSKSISLQEIETNLSQISKEKILKQIRKDCKIFKTIDFKYQNDKEIALEAIVMDGLLLKYVSENLKSDDEIVMEALKSNPMSLKFAGNIFKNDDKTVLDIVSRCGMAIKFVSPRLKNDIEIVTAAVKNDGRALRYLPDFKNNREIVLEAVKQNGVALLYADEKFFADREIVLNTVSQPQSAYLIAFISDNLKNDRDIILAACRTNKTYFKYASDNLKDKIRLEMIKTFTDEILGNLEDLSHKSKIKTRRKIK